jgi:hypothetical protein
MKKQKEKGMFGVKRALEEQGLKETKENKRKTIFEMYMGIYRSKKKK